VIFHIPLESESRAEQDDIYRFRIGTSTTELWPFVCVMATGKTFPSCSEVLLARATSLEDLKN